MVKMTLKVKVNDPPFSIPDESIIGCMFGANFVILAQICDELSCGQADFPRILSQNGQNDIEGQNHWPPFSIPAESIPGCMFGVNLVIELKFVMSYRVEKVKFTDGRTDRRTDGQMRATTIHPEPERPWGKSGLRNDQNAKISNWVSIRMFNELQGPFTSESDKGLLR